jgi:membrane associated rhomboid family serine protease
LELLTILVLFLGLVLIGALGLPLIPLRRLKAVPVVTISLIVFNFVLFLLTLPPHEGVIIAWGLVPRHMNLLPLFTYFFLHHGVDHVIFNLILLGLFGIHVEEALGRGKFMLFYLGAGIFSGLFYVLATFLLAPRQVEIPLVGASGAIAGVMGIFAVRFWRTRVRVLLLFQAPAYLAVGLFVAVQLFLLLRRDETDPTAYTAHIGGLLYGFLLAWVLQMKAESRHEYAVEDAEASLRSGQWERAAAYYRSLLASTPDDPKLHRDLATSCLRLGQLEAAERHFQAAVGGYLHQHQGTMALQTYTDATQQLAGFTLTPTMLTKIAAEGERLEQFAFATTCLSELCQRYPESAEAEMGMLRLGRLHLTKLGQPQNAVGILSEFLRLYPTSALCDHARQLLVQAEQQIRV